MLTQVTLEPAKDATIMTWDQYCDSDDLESAKAEFDRALREISEQLIARFGG